MVSLPAQARPAARSALHAARPKSTNKSLASVAQVFLCDFTSKALWGLAGLALIRLLDQAEYAALTLALALSGLMADGINENLNRVYIVGYQRLRLATRSRAYLTLQFSLLALSAAILFGLVGQAEGLYPFIVALAFANGAQSFVRTVLQRGMRFWSYSLLEMARTLLFLAAMVALIVWRPDGMRAWQILLLQAAALATVSLVALLGSLGTPEPGWPREAWRIARQIASGGFGLMIAYTLLMAAIVRVDVVMVKLLDSPLELATYGAAFRYYAVLMLLLGAAHTVMLPLTQQATTRPQLAAMFVRYLRAVLAIAPLILLGAWASQWVIPWIDGGRYPDATRVFQILSISTLMSLAFSPYVNLLYRYGDFLFLAAAAGADLVFDVLLNVVLIPRWHAPGAAAALCIATGTLNFVVFVRARALMASRTLPSGTSNDLASSALAAAAE